MAKIEKVLGSGNSTIDDLLTAQKWTAGTLTYAFATSASAYSADYGRGEAHSGFRMLSTTQQDAAQAAFAAWASVADIAFVQTGVSQAELRLASSSLPKTAWAYTPSEGEYGGDVWIGSASYNSNPAQGNYAFYTIMHEIGHAIGLSHPHDARTGGAACADAEDGLCPCCAGALHGQASGSSPSAAGAASAPGIDAMAFSVMSYRSFAGADIALGYSNEAFGYAQSPMARDIAATQHLYGANYDTNGGDTVYRWSETSGEKFLDGRAQGAPGANKIFETVWDGGGNDTFDLSNYRTDLAVDLNPGGWTKLGSSQLASLGKGQFAPGNIATAYLHDGDARALIENVLAGAGDDRITGNLADNWIAGGAGDDVLAGGAGNDILVGGHGGNSLALIDMDTPAALRQTRLPNDGNDRLEGGEGNDILVAGAGKDIVDGGAGTDTLVIEWAFDQVHFSEQGSGKLVISFDDGSVVAKNVEFVAFTDGIYALGNQGGNLEVSPLGQDIALLYRAALGRDLDADGQAYWTAVVEQGGRMDHIAASLIDSPEFAARFGQEQSLENGEFINLLYENVLGRDGDEGGLDYWIEAMAGGAGRAQVLLSFAQSEENVAAFADAVAPVDGAGVEIVAVSQLQWSMFAA